MDSQRDYGGHAFGFPHQRPLATEEFEMLIANRENVLPWIKEYSPIELVTLGRPADLSGLSESETPPGSARPRPIRRIRPCTACKLAERLGYAGVEVVLAYPGHEDKVRLDP